MSDVDRSYKEQNELFDLCKSVHEITGWKDTPYTFKRIRTLHTLEWKDWFIANSNNDAWNELAEQSVPLYTSDYVLEKLPSVIRGSRFLTLSHPDIAADGGGWVAGYTTNIDNLIKHRTDFSYDVVADTALLALLKLTIFMYATEKDIMS